MPDISAQTPYNLSSCINSISGGVELTVFGYEMLNDPTNKWNIKSVGNSAFEGHYYINSINLPVATSIGDSAFKYTISLESVSLPEATSIGQEAFSYCQQLTSVSLPEATSIGQEAFMNCQILASISLPSATSIGGYAFGGWGERALTSLELDSMTQSEVEAKAYSVWECQTQNPITVKCILTSTGQVGTFVLRYR